MAECQIPFGTQFQLLPSPLIVAGSIFFPGPPATEVRIGWDTPMDQTVLPPTGVWRIDRDDIPVPIIDQFWVGPTVLALEYTGDTPLVSGLATLLTADPNLRSLSGVIAKAPQSVSFFP